MNPTAASTYLILGAAFTLGVAFSIPAYLHYRRARKAAPPPLPKRRPRRCPCPACRGRYPVPGLPRDGAPLTAEQIRTLRVMEHGLQDDESRQRYERRLR